MAKKVKVTDLKELNIADSDLAENNDVIYMFMEVVGETPGTSKLVVPSSNSVSVNSVGRFKAKFELKAKYNFGTRIYGISDKLGSIDLELE